MTPRRWFDVHAHPQLHGFRPDVGGRPPGAHLPDGRDAYAESEYRDAGMRAVTFATVSDAAVLGIDAGGRLGVVRDFEPGQAYADHRRQLDALLAYAERAGLVLVRDGADLHRAAASDRTGMMLSCEGAYFVEDDVERIAEAHDIGVRAIGLVHYAPSRLGDCQTAPARHGGLTAAGRRVVQKANSVGMLVDVAHATFETTLGVLRVSTSPIMLSHTHLARGERSHPRLVSVAHARAVAADGGLVGAWPSGVACRDLADFADEVIRLVDAVGVDHVAVGTDLDGNDRPVLTRYAQFDALAGMLSDRGLDGDEVDGVLGGNAASWVERVIG